MITLLEDSYLFAVAAFDGVYGWMGEALAIIIFVLLFNFLAKWVLKRLHRYYQKQNKIWKDSFFKAIYSPLSYFVWFFAAIQTLDLIANRLDIDLPFQERQIAMPFGAVAAFAWFLMRWKRLIVAQMKTQSQKQQIALDQGKIGVIDKLATVFILFFTIISLMEVMNWSLTTLIAFGGVGGLALAFASQEIIANFFGGFMIYLTQPFNVGDSISLPDHRIEGKVEEIGWYMTRVRSSDKQPIYIPNAIFTKLIVITPSRRTHQLIKETISLRTEDSPHLHEVIKALSNMLHKHADIDQEMPIIVRFAGFGTFSLDITLEAYTLTIDKIGFARIKEDIFLKIPVILKECGADFASPTQQISFSSPLVVKNDA